MNGFDAPQNRILLAIVLIAAGGLLLAVEVYGNLAGFLWPFFIIAPGAAMLALSAREGGYSGLAIGGAIVTAVGLILLVQSLTDYYRSWAYAWALLPLAGGGGLLFHGNLTHDAQERARGRAIMLWSGTAFIALAAVFELVLFDGGNAWGRYVLPVILIGVGALLLVYRPGRRGENATPTVHHQE